MTNSPLINLTRISPNRNSPRNQPIRKITFHHFAGNLTIEAVSNMFQASSRQASYNYGIGTDGRIVLIVPERDRSWASSSPANDHQAITIGIANNTGAPQWGISDIAIQSAINLAVDVCERNGIKSLVYDGTPNGTVTRHDMFHNTVCPGNYLASRLPDMVDTINKRLKGETSMVWNTTTNRNHPAVLTFQKFLVEYLKPREIITGGLQGIIGPTTERAINVFKKENNLPENGTVDAITLVKMLEHAMDNDKYQATIDDLRAQLQREIARNSSLSTANDQLSKSNVELQKHVSGLKDEVSELQTEYDILMKQSLEYDGIIEKYKETIDEYRATNESLSYTNEKYKETIDEYRATNESLSYTNEKQYKTIENYTEIIHNKDEKLQKSTRTIVQLEKELASSKKNCLTEFSIGDLIKAIVDKIFN